MDRRRLFEALVWIAVGPIGLFVASRVGVGCASGPLWRAAALSVTLCSCICGGIALTRDGGAVRRRVFQAVSVVVAVPMFFAAFVDPCFVAGWLAGAVPYLQVVNGLFAAAILKGEHLPMDNEPDVGSGEG